jgi:hypothetical protein
MSSLQVAAAEKERVFPAVQGGAGRAADPIAKLVANDGTENARKQEPTQRKYILAGEDSSGDQKRIARQEEANE